MFEQENTLFPSTDHNVALDPYLTLFGVEN